MKYFYEYKIKNGAYTYLDVLVEWRNFNDK